MGDVWNWIMSYGNISIECLDSATIHCVNYLWHKSCKFKINM